MRNNKESIHSKAFIDGIILNNGKEEIVYDSNENKTTRNKIFKYNKILSDIPVIRGCVKTFQYFLLSIKSLNYTLATMEKEFSKEEINPSSTEEKILDKLNISLIHLIYFCGLILGCILALFGFILVPSIITSIISKIIKIDILLSIIEGGLRLVLFFIYMKLTHKIPEIKRMYMYHGAEHKAINCMRANKELTLEEVKKSNKYYNNCATYNLYKLAIIIILYFSFFSFDTIYLVNSIMRFLLFPIILGITYEFKILFIEHKQNVSRFGQKIQDIFLEEPSDEIIEIIIKSIKEIKVKETN